MMKLKSNFSKYATALYLSLGVLVINTQPANAVETTNKIGITMVDIPAGSFIMGSCVQDKKAAFLGESSCTNPDAQANNDEAPLHRVSIKKFQMGKTEVTLGQFKVFIKSAGRSALVDDYFMKSNNQGDNAAVVGVSWYDAQDFIKWLNQVDGGGYRLPSESEWEYACRAGGNHKYCGSNNINAVAWYEDNGGDRIHAVGTKQANAFGLHDMSGNAWEWVQDWYHDSYNGTPSDGSAWVTGGEKKDRVMRGGSGGNDSSGTRAALRFPYSPAHRLFNIGFRVARTVP